ncbi:hypothetical protein DFH08DRAFT_830644 [Mycena albidolilacea]|uniref:Vacuolar ATPase assembly integral membrane protein VMA21 n=1 Tax=Mycena albidolilacea TaxID=1033008 RepID=A0AAD7AU93_9AGAR|nr:hypothetical protein DFH08DRAFT_830644 [Mycena albidolilacea]
MSEQTAAAKIADNAASNGQLVKLIFFTLSLGIVPITSYFGSLKYLWNGNATYSAFTAVGAANLILVAYIITAILEDTTTAPSPPQDTKKTQ